MATIPERVWVKSVDGTDVGEIEYVRKGLVDNIEAELATCQYRLNLGHRGLIKELQNLEQQRDGLAEALRPFAKMPIEAPHIEDIRRAKAELDAVDNDIG